MDEGQSLLCKRRSEIQSRSSVEPGGYAELITAALQSKEGDEIETRSDRGR